MEKKVFIIISRSFLTRNILRSGTLALLKERGYSIDVFFQANAVPKCLKAEFEDRQVRLHAFTSIPHWFHRRINKLKRYLLDTTTSNLIIRHEKRSKITLSSGVIASLPPGSLGVLLRIAILKLISRSRLARRGFRFLERRVFHQWDSKVSAYFDQYKPDVVVSTSLISGFDVLFLKEASRRRITTISMPKGWDNLTKEYYPFLPDWFASPNAIAAKCATDIQNMSADRVRTIGLPQFDWYAKQDVLKDRAEHLKSKGLDPNRKTIFFGSEGAWSENDWRIAEVLYKWIEEDALSEPAQLFVRPHYSDVQSPKFKSLRGKPNVWVDDYPKVDFLVDKWDPTIEETIDFVNSVRHSDVIINIASSLALDAACADKPIILIGYGCEFEKEKDVTLQKLYGPDHMQWVLETKGADLARSAEELMAAIKQAFREPDRLFGGRARIRETLCYRVDGKSSERLADLVCEVLKFKK